MPTHIFYFLFQNLNLIAVIFQPYKFNHIQNLSNCIKKVPLTHTTRNLVFIIQKIIDKNNHKIFIKMISIDLPQIMEKKINALVEGGYYPNINELIKDAFKSLLESKADLKISTALEIYKKGDVTLGRASEIAGLSIWEFKEILKSRGVKIIVEAPSKDELDEQIDLMKH